MNFNCWVIACPTRHDFLRPKLAVMLQSAGVEMHAVAEFSAQSVGIGAWQS